MNKSLSEKHPVIFGALDCYDGTFDGAVRVVIACAESAAFFGWHDGVSGAIRTACHNIYVDPALVEAYLGCRIEELADDIVRLVEARTIRAEV